VSGFLKWPGSFQETLHGGGANAIFFMLKSGLPPFGLVLIAALPSFGQHHQKPPVTFESPTVCRGDHGFWRWSAKTDTALPPDTIAPDHHIKPFRYCCLG
jgi:hypothetical protein